MFHIMQTMNKKVDKVRAGESPMVTSRFSSTVAGVCSNAVRTIPASSEVYETVLYHELGRLPEPDIAHRFC